MASAGENARDVGGAIRACQEANVFKGLPPTWKVEVAKALAAAGVNARQVGGAIRACQAANLFEGFAPAEKVAVVQILANTGENAWHVGDAIRDCQAAELFKGFAPVEKVAVVQALAAAGNVWQVRAAIRACQANNVFTEMAPAVKIAVIQTLARMREDNQTRRTAAAIIDLLHREVGFLQLLEDAQVRAIQRVAMREQQPANFNPRQSTHTASVDASSSASALALQAKYQEYLPKNLIEIFGAMGAAIKSHGEDTLERKAALSCLEGKLQTLYFTDPSSQVTLQQLVNFIWMGINDPSERKGERDDAIAGLVKALYEVQRGGNLDETGVDDGKPDALICPAGTFNKLVEGMAGRLNSVNLEFVTAETIRMKFLACAHKIAVAHLSELSADSRQAWREECPEGDLGDKIWDAISRDVATPLYAEFGSFIEKAPDLGKTLEDNLSAGALLTLTPKELAKLKDLDDVAVDGEPSPNPSATRMDPKSG